MIDWVTAIIPCNHSDAITGGKIACTLPDGKIEWQVDKKKQVAGSHESKISIKTDKSTHLYFDGNPAKWLQGHNLFGSDNPVTLVEQVMLRLVPILNLSPTTDDLNAWKTGNYELKRVDCTAMWALPKRADVHSWLRAAEFQSRSRHGRPVTKGGTLYFGKNSRRWSIKFYSKGDELDATKKGHKLPHSILHRDNLERWADNKLRGELTLRSLKLKEYGLSNASKWLETTSLECLILHIAELNMAEQFSLTPAILDGLPARLIAVYKLWEDGVDLRGIYPKATFYRYRNDFLKHGIDILIRQPSSPDDLIPLISVLRSEAIAQVPDWAVGTTIYFSPKPH